MSLSLFYLLCRTVHFASVMTLLGCAAVTAWLAPHAWRPALALRFNRPLRVSAILALLSAVLLLVAQTGLMGDGWQDTTKPEIWRAVLGTQFGRAWQWQLVAALAGVLCLMITSRRRPAGLLASAVAQLVGLAFVGHAGMHEGVLGVLHRSNQVIHLLSAAFWAGSLLPVIFLMREAKQADVRDGAIQTMMRFSRYGHLAVALVILSGVINSLLILGWPLTTFQPYSQLLLLKTALVAVMCMLAIVNRYWLVPRFSRCGEEAQHVFVRTTQMEMILALCVVVLVSVFATYNPA